MMKIRAIENKVELLVANMDSYIMVFFFTNGKQHRFTGYGVHLFVMDELPDAIGLEIPWKERVLFLIPQDELPGDFTDLFEVAGVYSSLDPSDVELVWKMHKDKPFTSWFLQKVKVEVGKGE